MKNPKLHANLRLLRSRGSKFLRLIRRREYRRGLRHGVAASVEHAGIPIRNDIATVIDVGASRGQFALFAATRFPTARIISFEPLPGPGRKLEAVMGDRVEIRRTAVGQQAGTVTINISRQDDSSSVLTIGEAQESHFPGTEAVDSREVEMASLDQALDSPPRRPCLLKIDVQGLELEVLKGAEETLKQVDEALIECSFVELYQGQAMADEVIAFALRSGLRLAGIHGQIEASDGQPIQGDLHFRRQN